MAQELRVGVRDSWRLCGQGHHANGTSGYDTLRNCAAWYRSRSAAEKLGATPRSSPDRGCEGLRRNPATSDESGRRTVVHPIEPIPTGIANGRCGAPGTTPKRNSEIGFL